MNLSATITSRIATIPENTTFRYDTLDIPREQYATAAKVLERLQTKGTIKKISKGIFYKPRKTVFGELQPGSEEVLKDYLFEKGKRIAYLTGTYLYNRLGLTTQIPKVWQIASYNQRIFVQRGSLKATPVKSYVSITEENYRLLGFLDALKDWNNIPDLDQQQAIKRLLTLLEEFTTDQRRELASYALQYPPRVAAFLGALLDYKKDQQDLDALKNRLNPLTSYKLNKVKSNLPTAINWQIA
jgi:hypothetical protein